MAFQPIGCFTADEIFPKTSRAVGTSVIGPANGIALPDRFTRGLILVDIQSITDLTSVLSLTIEVSLDGGVNFITTGIVGLDFAISGYSINGSNILVDGGGSPVRVFGQPVRFPNGLSLTRRVRTTLSFSNGSSANQTFGVSAIIY
jgi:hypothetical protein